MKTIQEKIFELDFEIDRLENALIEKDKNIRFFDSYDDYMDYTMPEREQLKIVENQKRLIMLPYEFNEISEYGRISSVKDFIKRIGNSKLKDSDGFGFYIKNGKETNIMILPSDHKRRMIRKDMDGVVWYKEI